MNHGIKNGLAVVAGILVGGLVNMGLIMVSGRIIPPPPGADLTTYEGLQASMPLMQPKHFLMPFLAHALGTLVGAFVASRIAASHQLTFAMVVGTFFLVGGIINVTMLPSPAWFSVVDLVGAYIPMAWIGWRLQMRLEH